jgi:hypothetical protein
MSTPGAKRCGRDDCVADDAVHYEPVSAVKFPSIRERIGNFANPKGTATILPPKIGDIPEA